MITWGFYGLWWHWTVHKELCDHLGGPMRGQKIWIALGTLNVAMVAFWIMVYWLDLGPDRADGIPIPNIGVVTFRILVWVLWLLVAPALLMAYVKRQYGMIHEAKGVLDLPTRSGPVRFITLVFLGMVVVLIPIENIGIRSVGLVLMASAYWFLQKDYNDVWGAADLWESGSVERPDPTTSPYPR